jgi:hypothetical protein
MVCMGKTTFVWIMKAMSKPLVDSDKEKTLRQALGDEKIAAALQLCQVRCYASDG